jgi:hypothetical protein
MSGEEAITRFFKTAGEGQRCRPACSSLTRRAQLVLIDQEMRVRKALGSAGKSPKARKNGNQAAQRSPLALMDQTGQLAGQALQKGRSS